MKLFLTIDVECYGGDYDTEVYGGGYGLPLILKKLTEHRAKATFFVEALGATRWGLDASKKICTEILEAGQEVQLHIHPSVADIDGFSDDTDVFHMQSLEKQVMLIEKGLEILDKCGVNDITCFRAGDFAADSNTIEAMRKCALRVSSNRDLDVKCSTRSKLNDYFPRGNDVSARDGIIDVPLTVFRSPLRLFDGRYRHLEISAAGKGETAWCIEACRRAGYAASCLLTHPAELFSRKTGERLGKNIDRLEWFCSEYGTQMDFMSTAVGASCKPAPVEVPRAPLMASVSRMFEQGISRLNNG